jgi:hypothetical protein
VAQHDYVIANGTGAAVRSDLNNALAAIVSNNSGATEPATMYAYQWWADTTTGLLKIRNAANNAWITVGTLASTNLGLLASGGTLVSALGSASTPGITFTGDLNTGIYSPGADQVSIATGGSDRVSVDANGNVTINAQGDLRFADSDSSNWVAFQAPATVSSNVTWTLPSADGTSGQALTTNGSGTLSWASAAAAKISVGNTEAEVVDTGVDGHFKVTTEGTERLRVTAAGLVGIGTTSPGQLLHVASSATTGAATPIQWSRSSGANGYLIVDGSGAGIYSGSAFEDAGIYLVPNSSIDFRVNGSQRAKIDSSGRLLIGTSSDASGGSSTALLQSVNASGTTFIFGRDQTDASSATRIGGALFRIKTGSGGTYLSSASIEGFADGTHTTTSSPGRLVFSTTADGASSPTERVRITNQGQFNAFVGAEAGVFRSSQSSTSTNNALAVSSGATGTTDGIVRFAVETRGNVYNQNGVYGTISDERLKDNISDARSQWEDIKSVQIRNFNFKDGPDHEQIGVIAQEIELISPGLVSESPDKDESGAETGTATKYVNTSILYMKAMKALQEAMERIETLEAEVAALKAA